MICKNCGAQNADGAFICVNCGSHLEPDVNQNQNQSQSYNYGYSQNGNFSQQYNNQNGYQNNNSQGFNQSPNGGYTFNYNQNYNYTPLDSNLVKKGNIIVALVIGIITQSWVAVVLAIIALVRCSDFENAVRMGNYPLADQKRESIAKFRRWAWVFCGLGIAWKVIGIIISIAGIGLGIFSEFLPEIFDNFDIEFYDEMDGFSQMVTNLLIK